MPRVAVVTGANKGVGLAIVRSLCKQFDGDVILTSRDISRGEKAILLLTQEGLKPKFHQLDVTNKESINKLKKYLKENYGGIDVLINNAGILFSPGASAPLAEQAEEVIKINFVGAADASEILFDIFREGSRIVNISSALSFLSKNTFEYSGGKLECGGITNTEIYNKLKSDNITLTELRSIMQQFVTDVKAGNHVEKGWPVDPMNVMTYHVSKIGLNVLTGVFQRLFDAKPKGDMIANTCNPGLVATDMNPIGKASPDEGAACPVYLALLPPGSKEPKGKFLSPDKKVINWF